MKGNKIVGIVVAAGLSSRMKAFKPLLNIKGKTIIETLIERLRSAGVTDILVITCHEAEALEMVLEGIGIRWYRNEKYRETSMLDSAKLGFALLENHCDAVFFMPADMPLFMPYSLKRMVEAMFDNEGAKIVQPRYRGKGGHPILIAESLFNKILKYSGEDGLRGALYNLEIPFLELELPDPGLILDADTPEDYELLCQYADIIEK